MSHSKQLVKGFLLAACHHPVICWDTFQCLLNLQLKLLKAFFFNPVPTLIPGGLQSCSFPCLLLWCLNAAHRLLSSVCVTPRPTEKLHFRPELFKVDAQDFSTSSLSDAQPRRGYSQRRSQTADKHQRRNRMCRAALVLLTE